MGSLEILGPDQIVAMAEANPPFAAWFVRWIDALPTVRPLCVTCPVAFTDANRPALWVLIRPPRGTELLSGACRDCAARFASGDALARAVVTELACAGWGEVSLNQLGQPARRRAKGVTDGIVEPPRYAENALAGDDDIDPPGARPITLVALADLPIWVAWQPEPGEDPTKPPRKVPYRARGLAGCASPTNPADWGTRAEAISRAAALPKPLGGAGFGLVLGTEVGDGLLTAGIDLDTCRDRVTGNLDNWARQIFDRVGSYTEVSPSDTGLKVFFRVCPADRDAIIATIRERSGNTEAQGIKWTRGGGEHPPAIELFLGKRYFTVTEERFAGAPEALREVDAETLRWIVEEAGPALVGNGHDRDVGHGRPGRPRDGSRSGVAFRKGLALRRAGTTFEEFRCALRADPETAGWCVEKGEPHGGRELKRIWEKAGRIVAEPPYRIDPKAPYDVARLYRELRHDANDIPTLYHHRGGFYAWSEVAYPEVEDAEVRARLYDWLAEECAIPVKKSASDEWELHPVKPIAAMINNVIDALRAAALLPTATAPPTWLNGRGGPNPADLIACANGLLHLPTGELLPHTPGYFTHNALDFAFKPDAPAPAAWLRFLDQLWGDDAESIATLQEIFGYCLGADTSQQKAFLLVGPKRSGKGTIGRVLTKLVGIDNAVAPTLASLGANFGLMPLIGKRLAVISDARIGGRADQAVIAERLLSITGEDGITVDRKYREAWTGRLGVRFLVLTNELPRLADASGALPSRFVVMALRESFFGREAPGLTDTLLAELPGILNWAIEGWRRLRERGHFVQPASAMEAVAELEDLGSPIGAFLRERCVVGAGDGKISEFFLAWEDWCAEQRREPGDRQTFGRNLRAAVPGLRTANRRNTGGRRDRYYEGIRLSTVGERAGPTPEEEARVAQQEILL